MSWASSVASGATGYTVEWWAGGVKIDSKTVSGGGTLTTDIAGLVAETAYTFRVYATNAGGSSSGYATASATTLAATPAVPAAPGSASVSNVAATSVTVSWASSASSGATGYTVEWWIGGVKVNSKTVSGGGTLTTGITGLSAETAYTFRVYATNAGGSSAGYASASATTLAEESEEPTPSSLAPVPGSVKAAADGISAIVISWAAPKAPAGMTIAGYVIYNQAGAMIGMAGAGDTSYRVSGLSPGTAYTFSVATVYLKSDNTNVISAKPAAAKATTAKFVAPKAGKAVAGDIGLTTATVRWQSMADADAGYVVTWFAATDKKMTTPLGSTEVGGGETSYTVTGLSPGVKYTIVVQAKNTAVFAASGAMSAALTVSVTTAKFVAPKAGKAVAGDVGLTTAVVRWQSMADADAGYVVTWFAATDKKLTAPLGSTEVGGGETSYTVMGLSPGVKYTIVVQAKNTAVFTASGAMSAALTVSVTTQKFVAPKAAAAVKGDVGLTTVTVRWQAQPFADAGYVITWFDAKDKKQTTPLGTHTAAAGETSYTITGLSPGTAYTYTITAKNTAVFAASGALSAALSKAVTTAKFVAPKAAAAVAGDVGLTTAVVRWQSMADADAGYVVTWFAATDKKLTAPLGSTEVGGGETSYTVMGLSPGVKYTIVVQAKNDAVYEASGALSAALTKAVTMQKFVAPKAGKAVAGDVTLTTATVRWQTQPFADAGYVVTWYNASDTKLTNPIDSQAVPAGVTSYKIEGLLPGVKYTYTVSAVNIAVGAASPSAPLKLSLTTVKFTATATPAVKKGTLTAAGTPTLTWKPTALPKVGGTMVAGSVSYEVYYCTGPTKAPKPDAAGWSQLTETANADGVSVTLTPVADAKGKTMMTATLDGLEPGTTYYVFIRSIWSDDVTAFSNGGVLTIKTPR